CDTHRNQPEDQHACRHADLEVADDPRRTHQNQDNHDGEHREHPADDRPQRRRAGGLLSGCCAHPARTAEISPAGRHTSTASIAPKSRNAAYSGNNETPRVWTCPISSAPTRAPRTEPRPPTTTTTREMISTWS